MNKNNTLNYQKYYSIRKLSNLTGISANLIRFWKFQKRIPFIQERPGGAVLIPYAEFVEFLEKNTNKAEC